MEHRSPRLAKQILAATVGGLIVGTILYYNRMLDHNGSSSRETDKMRARAGTASRSSETEKMRDSSEYKRAGKNVPAEPDPNGAWNLSETMLASHLIGHIRANTEVLGLSEEQKALLVEDYLTYTKVRLEIERTQIKVKSFDGENLVLEIAPYPEVGKALRKSFYDQLGKDFAKEEVRKIDEVLGPFFEERFKGYGITKQSFEISRSASTPGGYRVVWSAVPLKHLIDPTIGYAGSGGQTTIGPNELIAGSYAALRDTIAAHLK